MITCKDIEKLLTPFKGLQTAIDSTRVDVKFDDKRLMFIHTSDTDSAIVTYFFEKRILFADELSLIHIEKMIKHLISISENN
jgi:hypothetical protein